jgi:phage shock protein PspC (stress-responsive transcriptional regulator)
MRALRVPRQHGWVGGVCAGVAQRLGIDPIIVRGIAVVVAVLGGPAFLLYAAAWLLLPDADDRIHLERLTKGDFDPANVGIGALVVLSLLPVTQGFWFLGASYWSEPYWTGSIGRALWTILLLAAAVVAIIWAARRSRRSSSEPTVTPATTDDRPETVPQPQAAASAASASAAFVASADGGTVAADGSSAGSATNASGTADPATPPRAPVQPGADATPEDLAAWREQQEHWRTEHAAWKQQQAASARELRDQRAAESHARAMANAAAADERRRLRRLTNPRVTGSHVVITLGAALLVGGIAAILSQSGGDWNGYGVTVGLAAATIVVALSAIIAGLFRRRSGFLGFVALLLVASTVTVSFIPPDRTLAYANGSAVIENGGRYAQLAGNFNIYSPNDSALARTGTLDLWQGVGDVYITVPTGMTVRVVANLGSATLEQSRYEKAKKTNASDDDNWNYVAVPTSHTRTADGRYDYDVTVGSGTPSYTVHIWQGQGRVQVEQQQPEETGVTQ